MCDLENKLTSVSREKYEEMKKERGETEAEEILYMAWMECVAKSLNTISSVELISAANAFDAIKQCANGHYGFGNTYSHKR